MFFRCSMNKTCDITNVVLSGNTIDYVHKTKYLGVLLCSDMKTSIDVCRQTSRFYAQANTLLRNFRYCSDDVKCMLFRSFCTNKYFVVEVGWICGMMYATYTVIYSCIWSHVVY